MFSTVKNVYISFSRFNKNNIYNVTSGKFLFFFWNIQTFFQKNVNKT